MKLANIIKISVFVKPEENEAPIKEAFLKLFPFDIEDERIILKKTRATSFSQRDIIIYEVELTKDRHSNAFLEFLKSKLDEQQRKMLVSQENRLDDNLDFFIRLDKQSLVNNYYNITDCGDCFHIRISIAAFPRKKESAMEVVKRIFF
ncbi:hypothetical protein JW756_03460 [Candidatus Woesearchaeota archaeon]|nr:hypothetical protein [Candidatus Woesearchaeota archaeon]